MDEHLEHEMEQDKASGSNSSAKKDVLSPSSAALQPNSSNASSSSDSSPATPADPILSNNGEHNSTNVWKKLKGKVTNGKEKETKAGKSTDWTASLGALLDRTSGGK